MADIEVKCEGCNALVTVSEYADLNVMTCRSCGGKLRMLGDEEDVPAVAPAPAPVSAADLIVDQAATQESESPEAAEPKPPPPSPKPKQQGSALSLRKQKEEQEEAPEAQSVVQAAAEYEEPVTEASVKDNYDESEDKPKKRLGPWIVFILLGIVMGTLRYGGSHASDFTETATDYGPFIVGALHIIITLKAFKDSIFQGILCLLVPVYSFYYLFVVSDDFWLRAISGGLLIGFGQDSAVVFQAKFEEVYESVTGWIQSGG